jgi:Flp pilus assembly protein TadD
MRITVTTKSPEAKAGLMKAWDLADNGRTEEALTEAKAAIATDADFAFAHTFIGMNTNGAAAQAELDKGVALAAAAKVPEAEKLVIEAFAAIRRQEFEKYYADLKKVAELAPEDFHAHTLLASTFVDRRDFSAAEAADKKALELNPKASFVYRALADAQAQQKKYDDALASAKKYAEAAANEPGAHQALGSAMLNVDKAKDAVAEFAKAVELGPKDRSAYYDLATVKAITGDYAGAKEAIEKSKAAEVQPTDGLERANNMAWLLFDEGKDGEALALLEKTEKDADKDKLPWPAEQAALRSRAMFLLGKGADARKSADAQIAKCDSKPESSELYKVGCHLTGLLNKAFAEIAVGNLADAKKTVAELTERSKKWPENRWLSLSAEMFNDQLAALEKKDKEKKAAAELLAKCPPDDFFWRVAILRMAEKDGDKATVEQVKKELARPVKDFAYPLVAKLGKK